MMNSPLLSCVTFFPLLGLLVILWFPQNSEKGKNCIRIGALITSILVFLLSLKLYFGFNPDTASFQFVEKWSWIPRFGVHYYMGLDGLSLWLVLLTTFLTPITILSTWKAIDYRVKEFQVAMLALETAMIGTFLSLDLFLFYCFWEAMLIPMYLIIGVWGGPRRIYAAIKFFLYTAVGSLLM